MSVPSEARPSDNLKQRLRNNNFTLYSSPQPANDMTVRTLSGRTVNLSSLKGKVVILNFWKLDCPPCSLEKPILERIFRKYSHRGLEILAVNLFDEESQIRSYRERMALSFTLAHDPDNRFSVRRQFMASGIPTSFVVNSDSEAIYEVPGVPTTYVVNRKGQVAGYSAGMINWEDVPFAEFLENLLGTPMTARAEEKASFADAAGQGPVSAPGSRPSGPRKSGDSPPEPAPAYSGSTSMPPEGASPPSSQNPPLPFQSPLTKPAPTQGPSVVGAPAAPTPDVTQPPVDTKPVPQQKPARAKKKPDPKQAVKPSTVKHKPPPPAADSLSGPRVTPPPAAAPGTGPGMLGDPLLLPPLPPAATSGPAVGARGTSSLPPLPPGIPYTPPRSSGPPAGKPLVPDDSGRVVARIPGSPQGPGTGPLVTPGFPPGRPPTGTNPIDGFILDSFGPPRSRQPIAPQPGLPLVQPQPGLPPVQQQPQGASPPSAPPTSVLDQMGRDFRQLGQGITDLFSRIVPPR